MHTGTIIDVTTFAAHAVDGGTAIDEFRHDRRSSPASHRDATPGSSQREPVRSGR